MLSQKAAKFMELRELSLIHSRFVKKQIEALITNDERLHMFRSSMIKNRSNNHYSNFSKEAVQYRHLLHSIGLQVCCPSLQHKGLHLLFHRAHLKGHKL